MFKIGIVGAGIIGITHRDAILKTEECILAAVCDIAKEKAEELAKSSGAAVYTDYKQMAENEELDGVILNLPHFLHKEVTVYFLERKIPVLVEKPMALNVRECDEMIDASKKNNTPLAVGHVQKYNPCFKAIRDIVSEERLGKLCLITETRNVDYFVNRPQWFLKKELSGGGILMNYGAHTLDKLFYTTSLPVAEVNSVLNNFLNDSSVEASAQVLLKLEGGAGASFTYCGCHAPIVYETSFYFTEGTAQVRGGWELWVSDKNKKFEKITTGKDEVLVMKEQLEEFIKLVKGEKSEVVTPEYAREIISVLEKALMG